MLQLVYAIPSQLAIHLLSFTVTKPAYCAARHEPVNANTILAYELSTERERKSVSESIRFENRKYVTLLTLMANEIWHPTDAC